MLLPVVAKKKTSLPQKGVGMERSFFDFKMINYDQRFMSVSLTAAHTVLGM